MQIRFDYPITFDNLIEDFLGTDILPARTIYPAIDIAEQENETVVLAELPGVKKEDVKISIEKNVLTIRGERKPYEAPDTARVLLNEVPVRPFSRSLELQHDVDGKNVSAELTDGVLRIVLPKAESARTRTIEIR